MDIGVILRRFGREAGCFVYGMFKGRSQRYPQVYALIPANPQDGGGRRKSPQTVWTTNVERDRSVRVPRPITRTLLSRCEFYSESDNVHPLVRFGLRSRETW